MFIDGFSSFSHHFLIIFSALNLRLEKNGSRRGDVPALQLPRLDLSISAAQLGRNDLWSWMVLVFEKIPWCPWWTPGFWMCFFVGNVNDNVNGYVWMILDVFGCCYEHILSNVWRFSFFFAWFAYVCLNFISGQLVGLKKWRFPKSWGYPSHHPSHWTMT